MALLFVGLGYEQNIPPVKFVQSPGFVVAEAGEEDVGVELSIPMTGVTSAESEDIMHMIVQDLVVAVQEVVVVGHPDIPGQDLAVGQGHTREVTPGAEAGVVAGRGRGGVQAGTVDRVGLTLDPAPEVQSEMEMIREFGQMIEQLAFRTKI